MLCKLFANSVYTAEYICQLIANSMLVQHRDERLNFVANKYK